MIKRVFKWYFRGFREYRLLSEISEGGMSTVYKALSRVTGEIVAIKILFPKYADKRMMLEKLFEEKHVEGDIAASLFHPNVIRTYSYGRVRDQYYFVMEYVKGPNLKNAIYRQSDLLEGKKIDIIIQIAKALRYIHQKGIIHRDVCSKNLLLNEEGRVKLIDFGLAVTKSGKYKGIGERAGTPSYMSPEQIRALEPDERTDIYSLGIVMYEIIAGEAPFSGDNDFSRMQNHLNVSPVKMSSRVSGIHPDIEKIVEKAMQKNPADRYGSVENLIFDLKEYTRKRGDF